jgi:hypothetical protein
MTITAAIGGVAWEAVRHKGLEDGIAQREKPEEVHFYGTTAARSARWVTVYGRNPAEARATCLSLGHLGGP